MWLSWLRLCKDDRKAPSGTGFYCVKQRYLFYHLLLGEVLLRVGFKIGPKYNFSSTNIWTIGMKDQVHEDML